MPTTSLSPAEIDRYSRQLILNGWSTEVQLRLRSLSVRIPLTLPSAAMYLAAVGVGEIVVLGKPSASQSLVSHLRSLNSSVLIRAEIPQTKTELALEVWDLPAALKNSCPSKRLTVTTCFSPKELKLRVSGKCTDERIVVELPGKIRISHYLLAGTTAAAAVIRWQLEVAATSSELSQ